jgi:predicted metal-dependent hydrolase
MWGRRPWLAERTLHGDPDVTLTLRRSRAARRFSLRVSQLDGRVTLTLPERASEAEAMAFAAGQGPWLRRAVARAWPADLVGMGTVLPFEGRMVTVAAGPVRAARIEGDLLLIPDDPGRAGMRTQAYLKLSARSRLQAASDRYAAALGRPYRNVTLRDTRSRWGSCTADGALMYSWRLIMAPPDVLDYVAAHEVAHLAEMNHSPDFWAVVARLMPDYSQQRRWIKTQGHLLHRYRFGD